MISVNNKISLIKMVREKTGMGLKEAKDIVEDVLDMAEPFDRNNPYNEFDREFLVFYDEPDRFTSQQEAIDQGKNNGRQFSIAPANRVTTFTPVTDWNIR